MGLNAHRPHLRLPVRQPAWGSGSSRPTDPAAVSLMADYYPVANRARMMGRYQLGAAFGGLLGVALAGVLVDTYSWRAAFWMWVPLGRRSWSCWSTGSANRTAAGRTEPSPRRRSTGSRPTASRACCPTSTSPTSHPRRAGRADRQLGRRHPRAAPHPHHVVRADGAHHLAVLLRCPRLLGHRVLQAGLRPQRHQGRRLRTAHRSRGGARAGRRRRGGRSPPATWRRERARARDRRGVGAGERLPPARRS